MNLTPVTGWYYINANERTASWTGVNYFYKFITGNSGAGPFGVDVQRSGLMPGDVIQLGRSKEEYYHSLIVMSTSANDILLAAHSNDALFRPLSSYHYNYIRCIHIIAAREE